MRVHKKNSNVGYGARDLKINDFGNTALGLSQHLAGSKENTHNDAATGAGQNFS